MLDTDLCFVVCSALGGFDPTVADRCNWLCVRTLSISNVYKLGKVQPASSALWANVVDVVCHD